MEKLTDESIMPWGIHKGKKLKDVNPHFLIWLHHKKRTLNNMQVWDYIHTNLTAIERLCLQKRSNTP